MEEAASIRNLLTRGLDFVFPPRCLACGVWVDQTGSVCSVCWGKLRFITAPCCACCGLPFDYDPGPGALCGACVATPPLYHRARAALAYDDASRPLLVRLKYHHLEGVSLLAAWMRRAGADLFAEADVITAVPLHRWRLLKRGYNQSGLLAQRLAALTGVRCLPDLLLRTRPTISQGGLSRSGRQRNISGAFALNPRYRDLAAAARIILVDDVFTTGATLGECCRVLRRGKAARIDVLTAARVL